LAPAATDFTTQASAAALGLAYRAPELLSLTVPVRIEFAAQPRQPKARSANTTIVTLLIISSSSLDQALLKIA
jgi:hypothetical protein